MGERIQINGFELKRFSSTRKYLGGNCIAFTRSKPLFILGDIMKHHVIFPSDFRDGEMPEKEREFLELIRKLFLIDPQALSNTLRKIARGKIKGESTEEIREAFEQERQALRN